MRVFPSLALGLIFPLLGCGVAAAQMVRAPVPTGTPAPPPMVFTSPAYVDGGVIPDLYSAVNASPVSPPLSWDKVPAEAVTLALIMHDPEAIVDKSSTDLMHWLVFNIPATTHGFAENMPKVAQLPDGTIQLKNRSGVPGYAAPGARVVYHHYTIELYALDAKLDLGPDATRAQLLAAMDGHVIRKGLLVGLFRR